MDYEKLYKEALDNLNRIKNESPEWWREHEKTMQEIFPGFFETENERIKNGLVKLLNCIAMKEYEDTFCITKEEALAWLEKQGEQKPAWSEEDEKKLNKVIEDIVKLAGPYVCYHEDVDWLKSLKDKVLPKQEWSEEDKCMLNNVIDTLKPLSQTTHSGYAINSMINWLNSLEPQNKWKPTEEMLEALYRAVPENVMEISEDEMLLDKLYQGLKYGKILSEK